MLFLLFVLVILVIVYVAYAITRIIFQVSKITLLTTIDMKKDYVFLSEEDFRNESFPQLPPDGVFELDVHLETSEVYDTIRKFISDQLLKRNVRIVSIIIAHYRGETWFPDRMIIRCSRLVFSN